MKLEISFFRSKVARRVFFLFVTCTLIPISTLSLITYLNMGNQLREQSQRELLQASKSMGMAIFERLLLIEAEMKMISSNLSKIKKNRSLRTDPRSYFSLNKRFKGLSQIHETGEIHHLFGNIHGISALASNIKRQTVSDKTLVITKYNPENQSRIFMASFIDSDEDNTEILIAEVFPSYLWFFGYDDPLPNGIELSVLDQSHKVLFSSQEEGNKLSHLIDSQPQSMAQGTFDWASSEDEYIASFRAMFLTSQFNSQKWIIVISKSKSSVFAPLSNFKLTFPPIILVTFWIVLLLSSRQIRKCLGPLEKLKEGTKRIAKRDFESRIEVHSRDEFEDVAVSFNSMASQLGRQFKTLRAMVDIDRAILSALDTEKIVATILSSMNLIFLCNGTCVSLLDPNDKFSIQAYIGTSNPHYECRKKFSQISTEEIQRLKKEPEILTFSIGDELPPYLKLFSENNLKFFLVLPLFIQEELSGIISLGYSKKPPLDQEGISQARQLADQVAVALSNARLIDELNQFNWGTLTALARAIDAKSSWTAGHSEKVTKIALQIGKVLGLSSEESEVLHRGGLLHDIGKLGISHEILDKPGTLSEKEKVLMQKHVLFGARILEPIAAYKEIMPIILEHHENFDGTGYPFGLSGENISLCGRIVAVADRFEALTSNRPYRRALDQHSAAELIKEKSGGEFDPRVVKTFLEIIR